MEEYRQYPKDRRFSVSRNGTIKGVTGRVLKGCVYRGYRFIGIIVNGKVISEKVARIVAFTWVRNPKPKIYDTVNHINGIKTDDRADNLEWCTQSQNMIHASEHGLLKFGSDHYLAKLDESQVKVIKSGLLDRFTDKEIGDYFKVHKASINRIRHGVSWKQVKPC